MERKDAPLVIGAPRPGKPRYIGVNATTPQECKPSRVLDGSGTPAGATAADTAKKSAAGVTEASSTSQLVVAATFAAMFAAWLL